ncbi:GHKL domain-containing protein [Adhaeribacter swui]|uniref:histidine kinase n=1 Tax=Adhaeribacter swui TaxID=2086471 RepID=A0A7G7GCB5_9BACT|nr:ATP-binding protein [Adhaeribacter swui]QNF34799.1 GHKL domain-containing protein [Adhaeribacter swui]
MQSATTEWLQSIESLKDVPPDQLQWWLDNSVHREMPEGSFLFKLGEPIIGTYVIVQGRVRMWLQQKNNTRKLGYFEVKDITGFLPFSRGTTASANGQVEETLQVMIFPVEKMKDLIVQHYELTQALVHIMTSRVRDFTTMQQQNEKMMALGKLSAGLAHELNNPASAIVRGSISLKKHLQLVPDTFKKVIAVRMSPEDVDKVNDKMFAVLGRPEKPILTLMQRTALEDELAECLEDMSVDNSQELAENFIEFGFTCQDMTEFSELIPAAYLSPMLNWINNNLVTEKMVTDIQEASQRIEKLVSAIKNFTHMDRDRDKEYVDIHGGIKNTLTMLGHKLKKGNVQLVEEYDLTLPRINAYVGELNQVWTNLIDNALDALDGVPNGRLDIKTKQVNSFLEVSITDNGPGIPEEIKNRIFDPFFTTKDVGKGTGLGLDVVTRIVQQHNGHIKFNSQPGQTTFCVYFPLNGQD